MSNIYAKEPPKRLVPDESQLAASGGLLRIEEAARFLGVGKTVLYQWINAGRIRAVRLSPKATRIERRELEAFIDAAKDPEVPHG